MSTARIIRTFQRYILSTLLIVMGVVIVASSIELVIVVVQELLDPPLLLDLDELTKIGGLFLTVLITVELFGILEVMLLKNPFMWNSSWPLHSLPQPGRSWSWRSLQWLT